MAEKELLFKMMAPENLKIEALDENGKWIEYKEENYEQIR